MSTIAAAVLTADRIDNWIRRQVMQYWLQHDATDFATGELWPAQPQTTTASSPSSTRVSAPRRSRGNRLSQSKAVLAWDSSVWLAAIGNASRPSTTLLRSPSRRISLRSSNSSKRRNRKTARFRSDTCEPKNREAYHVYTKAALARLRSGSTRSAGDRNRHY